MWFFKSPTQAWDQLHWCVSGKLLQFLCFSFLAQRTSGLPHRLFWGFNEITFIYVSEHWYITNFQQVFNLLSFLIPTKLSLGRLQPGLSQAQVHMPFILRVRWLQAPQVLWHLYWILFAEALVSEATAYHFTVEHRPSWLQGSESHRELTAPPDPTSPIMYLPFCNAEARLRHKIPNLSSALFFLGNTQQLPSGVWIYFSTTDSMSTMIFVSAMVASVSLMMSFSVGSASQPGGASQWFKKPACQCRRHKK